MRHILIHLPGSPGVLRVVKRIAALQGRSVSDFVVAAVYRHHGFIDFGGAPGRLLLTLPAVN